MKRKWFAVTVLLLLLSAVLAACSPTLPAGTATEAPAAAETGQAADAAITSRDAIKLGVGYIPNVQFAPLYAGIEQGFFAAEGIDLTLEYGYENDYLKLVGVGEMPFMIGSGDQVVLGRAQGLPVRYVANWYSRFPVVVFAKAEAGIQAPSDLRGKRIGLPGLFGANYVALRGLLEAGGLTEQDVKLESIGFTQVAAINEDTVDAAVDYAVNGPVVLGLAGVALDVITLDPYMTIPANGLVTNEATIAENPDLVARMVRALQKSIAYAVANPDAAFAAALTYVPEAGGANEATNRAIFDASLPFWTPAAGAQPGATQAADWQAAAELMQRAGLIETTPPAADLFTNQFLEN
jgi:NitT/TauT family transport system substrate-binding protein